MIYVILFRIKYDIVQLNCVTVRKRGLREWVEKRRGSRRGKGSWRRRRRE